MSFKRPEDEELKSVLEGIRKREAKKREAKERVNYRTNL
jgi:hypothetical protein